MSTYKYKRHSRAICKNLCEFSCLELHELCKLHELNVHVMVHDISCPAREICNFWACRFFENDLLKSGERAVKKFPEGV